MKLKPVLTYLKFKKSLKDEKKIFIGFPNDRLLLLFILNCHFLIDSNWDRSFIETAYHSLLAELELIKLAIFADDKKDLVYFVWCSMDGGLQKPVTLIFHYDRLTRRIEKVDFAPHSERTGFRVIGSL